MRLVAAASVLKVTLLAACAATAQQGAARIPDAVARKMLELGLKNIHRAVCDGFNQCAPTTQAELKSPPITLDQARAAIVIGGRSAYARWCGLDSDRRRVLPFLRQLRRSKLYNERQLALMAVIHGIQQSITTGSLEASGECDAETRGKLDGQLPKS
jgi:hypothetical protein